MAQQHTCIDIWDGPDAVWVWAKANANIGIQHYHIQIIQVSSTRMKLIMKIYPIINVVCSHISVIIRWIDSKSHDNVLISRSLFKPLISPHSRSMSRFSLIYTVSKFLTPSICTGLKSQSQIILGWRETGVIFIRVENRIMFNHLFSLQARHSISIFLVAFWTNSCIPKTNLIIWFCRTYGGFK